MDSVEKAPTQPEPLDEILADLEPRYNLHPQTVENLLKAKLTVDALTQNMRQLNQSMERILQNKPEIDDLAVALAKFELKRKQASETKI